LEAKCAGKYAEFGEICGTSTYFSAYFQHMQIQVMENDNYDSNRLFLHSFDIFDFNLFNV